jgi:hypothetical protein
VLAISREDSDTISGYLDKNGFTVRSAVQSSAGDEYGVKGIPKSFLIAPDGTIAWSGHPGSLSKGTVKDALKKADKLPADAFMVVKPSMEAGASLSSAIKAARAGKLGKALEAAKKVADSGADDAAGVFVADIEGHLELLLEQAGSSLERMDMIQAVRVYGAISKELAGTSFAESADAKLESIAKDPVLKRELEAAEAFEKTRTSAAKLATSKRRGKYEKFAKKYADTKAGKRAKTLVRGM